MSLTPMQPLILDGYVLTSAGPGNASSLQRMPNMQRLIPLPGTP